VAPAVGGNVEARAVLPGCRLVPVHDPKAMSSALRCVAAALPEPSETPALRSELVGKRYSVRAMVDRYEQLYSTRR
jgi:hypothetical protein